MLKHTNSRKNNADTYKYTKIWAKRVQCFFFYCMLSPKYMNTLFLNARARSTISDSRICLVMPSNFSHIWSFRDNRFATSTVKLAMSLLFVNKPKTVAEYAGFETSLLSRIRASLNSKVLHNITLTIWAIIKRSIGDFRHADIQSWMYSRDITCIPCKIWKLGTYAFCSWTHQLNYKSS